MVRTAKWKYVYCELGGTEELYDMTLADCEFRNMAADSRAASVKDELRGTLIRWCVENGDDKMVQDGRLAVSHADGLPEPKFEAGRMGWRKY
jgi:hypothetical protein